MKFQCITFVACLSLLAMVLSLNAAQGVEKPLELVSSGGTAAPGTYDVGGTAYAINLEFGYVVVQTNKGCYQAIYVDSNSSIIKNGLSASISDISVGNRIRSNNSMTTGHALTIDVR